MASEKEARALTPKGNSDDIVVVRIRNSGKDWLMLMMIAVIGSLLGGLLVFAVQCVAS